MDYYVQYIVKAAILVIYVYAFLKLNKAKRVDSGLAFKMDLRSKIELGVTLIANILFIAFKATRGNATYLVLVGGILVFFTYLQLGRLVLVGNHTVYTKYLSFDARLITSKSYEKRVLTFSLRGGSVEVKHPLGDVTFVMQQMMRAVKKGKRSR